ncbi:MAG: endonuclease/exonuclease/phosphatase family protein [Sphaerospermopsis sp. SIO1G2]|nr:endonuclease/exonuclease/phosphatase family protein [Sphaerospermopsis sp. SIO1G2]
MGRLLLYIWSMVLLVASITPILLDDYWLIEVLGQIRWHVTALVGVTALALLLCRHFYHGALMTCLVIANMAWIYSAFPPHIALDDAEDTSIAITSEATRVVSHNIWKKNSNKSATAMMLHDVSPDLLLLIETGWREFDIFYDILEPIFPYHSVKQGGLPVGIALLSRYPMHSKWVRYKGEYDQLVMLHAVVDMDQPVHVLGLHMRSPRNLDRLRGRNEQLDFLYEYIASEIGIDVPLMVMGDFNSVFWRPEMRRFAELGLRRADDNPWFTGNTWPASMRPPMMLAIDHIFYNDHLCAGASLDFPQKRHYSDHRPVGAELFLCDREKAATQNQSP